MKTTIAVTLVISLLSLGMIGCTDTSKATTKTQISTPGGTTTITTERTVEKTGEQPPAAP